LATVTGTLCVSCMVLQLIAIITHPVLVHDITRNPSNATNEISRSEHSETFDIKNHFSCRLPRI
jgi:hypothetical protein